MIYKYRSLANFQFLTDILLNERLYAANYLDLNDPMEGHYLYPKGKLNGKMQERLNGQKMKTRICSLTASSDNLLMWSHYADGARGVLLGMDIVGDAVEEVIYREELPVYGLDCETAQELFTYKLSAWSYEEEYRVFTESSHVQIRLREIVLGPKMGRSDKALVIKLIGRLRPDFKKGETAPNCMGERCTKFSLE